MQEQKKFISNIHPFNNLNTFELDDLVEDLDIVYFKANSIVQAQDSNPEFLYFVLKGLIQEINDDEVLSVYSKGEIFDSVSLIKIIVKIVLWLSKRVFVTLLKRDLCRF